MMGRIIFWLVFVGYVALLLRCLISVVLDNRPPIKTIAWIMVLIFLPFVGLIFFFLVGQNTRKERYISKNCASQLARKSMLGFYQQPTPDLPDDYAELIRLFHRQNAALPFPDNHLDIYTNGGEMLMALMREMGRAKAHIHLQTYILADDPVGRLVRDMLMDKARAGVEVRLIYDDVGCWKTPRRFFEQMREAGVEVRSFMPVLFPQFTSRANYRNHRKIAVIDGHTGFIGGMNLAIRYVRGISVGAWHDAHLRITGSAVYGLQRSFLEDWFFVDRSLVTASKYYPPIEPNRVAEGGALVQIVSSTPVGPWRDIMQGLVALIMRARRYIYIQTPYFLPAEAIIFALQTAALAGIDVRMMLPMRSDSKLMTWASHSYLEEILRAGVQVYLFEAGFLHSKLIVCDDEVATCGSTNMDFRSFEHNLEVNAFIYDHETALRMKAVFHDDQKHSQQLSLRRWEKRPKRWRILESLIRLLTPLL